MVYIAGMGMITAIGGSAPTTAVAVRARSKGMRMSPVMNKNSKPMIMACVPDDALPLLDSKLDTVNHFMRYTRLLRLATPALQEVLESVPLKAPPPLFLAVPESLPDCPSAMPGNFLDHLRIQSGANINWPMSRLIATGRAGGVQAVDLALKYFASTGNDVVLVGGVDTYQSHFLLGVLDNQDRILAEDIQDGFVPGEAAGVLMLVSARVVSKLPKKPLAALYPPGLANEPGHRYSDEPYRGDGLADAFREAIEHSNGQPIQTIYSSMTGEHVGAKELGVAQVRNNAAIAATVNIEHPADGFGDIGAACGPVLMALAALDLQKGWRQGPALVYGASEQQARAAIVVCAV
jgi:3-oxoacyl-[acyl-carrier-protein] synthase-1